MSEYNKFYIDANGNIGTKKSGDNFMYGFLIGTIVPIILFIVLINGMTNYEFSELLAYSWKAAGNSLFLPVMIGSLMPNMFVFFWMYKTERWNMTRGLVVATFFLLGLFAARAYIKF
ncbi:MAG: hypothetical protein MJY63_06035 [Paludibacteraceae bacterium]|nr:hypothetical protein [Paludibacteraceae bacterium]